MTVSGWTVLALTVAIAGVVCLAMIEPQSVMFLGFCAMVYGIAKEAIRHV